MITIYFKLANGNKWSFLGILFCCLILLFIMPLILSVKDFYEHYSDIRLGFIPDIAITLKEAYQEDIVKIIIEKIKQKYPIDHTLQGAQIQLVDTNFIVQEDMMSEGSFFETIHKDITILGIDFKDNKQIKLKQKSIVTCDVKQLGEFGHWFIDIKKSDALKEGMAAIIDDNNEIPVTLIDRGSFFRVRYSEPEQGDLKNILFYEFINRFMNRFQKTVYSGIGVDRFSTSNDDNQESKHFQTHLKRHILAYAGLIFTPNTEKLSAIVSSDLLHSINKYDYMTMANLVSEQHNINIPVVAFDAFHFFPEKYLKSSMLLTNINQFKKFLPASKCESFIYIYCEPQYIDHIIKDLKNENITAIYSRNQIVPSYFLEKNIVRICIHSVFILFILVWFCIISIKLIKFYSVFQDDITLLKLYGYNFSIYSVTLSLIILFGNSISLICLTIFFNWNNNLLNIFYYPTIGLNLMNFIYTSIICFSGVCISYILERSLINKISYTSRGQNQ